ncbi:hypothetical protein ACW9HR_22170 [Nocardia gipuzkoensis]
MTEAGQERGSARGFAGELDSGALTIAPEDGDVPVVGWFLGTVFDVENENGDPFRSGGPEKQGRFQAGGILGDYHVKDGQLHLDMVVPDARKAKQLVKYIAAGCPQF